MAICKKEFKYKHFRSADDLEKFVNENINIIKIKAITTDAGSHYLWYWIKKENN